ncbi:glycosyltransferase [Sphingomonas sp. SRS2]|uniref:glycosyltransferase n=1 Tax=Sphingomonas sp. SRS2 TaxID=133190 RepID=UPI000618464A|nr:glycosyltransferase [Sphingomonas sp. SRS2]KKC27027.1 group 1 glycosyl transferase [Sphingomonas sp. SRS2]
MRKILRFSRRIFAFLFPRPDTPARKAARLGDAARGRRDWPAAAEAYRTAVSADPDMAHIWIQLGHALKEQGDLTGAIEAYGAAAARRPDLGETHIFLAHLHKMLNRIELAIVHFLKALHSGEQTAGENDELLRLLAQQGDAGRAGLIDLLASAFAELPPAKGEARLLSQIRDVVTHDMTSPPPAATSGDPRPALVFDISDLIGYYANARLPTGIQRVQLETIEGALSRADGREIRLCCFIDGREEWLELPLGRMRAIARLSVAGGDRFDPEWTDAVAGLRLFLSLTHAFEFPHGASLINLGTSWWLQNYFLFVRHAKATRGIRYIPFVHDMIPIMTPEHCTRGLTQDFISWVIGVFDHADHFLVNSQATKKDLLTVAATLGHELAPDDVAVIPLDTDFRKPGATELPDAALDRWQLRPDGFVLFVSTIESRKGHLIAFDAWADLIARHGPDAVPQLVCVGNRGWLNDRIYQRLANDPVLAAKVSMLSRLSDEELSLLYRTCRFTVYPSTYEGWGLPVTESLCCGKVPLISDAASLPEAGGDFAVYVPAGSAPALADAAERLILDAEYRAALESRIRAEFRPRAWSDLAHQIADELDRFATRDVGSAIAPLPPLTAKIGAWHAIARNESTRIWRGMRTGEGFRADLGWYWPDNRGCRVRREGGELLMRIDGPHKALRILVELVGDEHADALWSLRSGDIEQGGEIRKGQRSWTTFTVDAAGASHELRIRFEAPPAGDGPAITYFVSGFFLHAIEDIATRQDFAEAVALGRLDWLDAFRDR